MIFVLCDFTERLERVENVSDENGKVGSSLYILKKGGLKDFLV